MGKKIFFVLVLAFFLSAVYASGNAKDVPMENIESQIKEVPEISSMAKCDNRNLMQFFGLDYTQYDSYIYYKGTEALSVEELLIIKAHSSDELSAVKDAVEKRIDTQTKTFEGYGPAQVALLSDAILTVRGNYLFYCVSDYAVDYEEVFRDAI